MGMEELFNICNKLKFTGTVVAAAAAGGIARSEVCFQLFTAVASKCAAVVTEPSSKSAMSLSHPSLLFFLGLMSMTVCVFKCW